MKPRAQSAPRVAVDPVSCRCRDETGQKTSFTFVGEFRIVGMSGDLPIDRTDGPTFAIAIID